VNFIFIRIRNTLFVFEVDHSLADGFSLIKLLYRLCGKIFTMPETQKDSFRDNLLIKHFYLVGLFIFRFPYEFGRYLLNSNLFQSRWPERNAFSGERRNYFGSVSGLKSFQKIREVRQKHKVSSVAVTVAAFAAAIRSVIFDGSDCKEIPKSVAFNLPFPLPGNPDKLRNHA
jgi:hypothetical protein